MVANWTLPLCMSSRSWHLQRRHQHHPHRPEQQHQQQCARIYVEEEIEWCYWIVESAVDWLVLVLVGVACGCVCVCTLLSMTQIYKPPPDLSTTMT